MVSKIIDRPVFENPQPTQISNSKLQTKNYNFSIDCRKFENNFNFKFKESIETITESIVSNFDKIILTKRDKIKTYEL